MDFSLKIPKCGMSENCLTLGHDNVSKSCQNLSYRHFDCSLKMAKMAKMGFGNKTTEQNS